MPNFSSPQREDGFTLVEVLVAMLISTIVLLATLQSVDLFTTNAAQQTRDTDANGQLRLVMDRTVRDLRSSSSILKATANDLVYTVPQSANTRVERLCVSSGRLYGSSSTTVGTPAVPGAACAAGTKVATQLSRGLNAFTYDGATSVVTAALPSIKNVGITFDLDASGGGKTSVSTLSASAARRASSGLSLTDTDLVTKCGNNSALLNLSADVPGVAGMTVTYTTSTGTVLGSGSGTATTTITLPSVKTTVIATIVDSLGVTKLLSKDVQCD